MNSPKINTMKMEIEAYSESEALAIAHKTNEYFCENKMSCFLAVELEIGEWLVILAVNEAYAQQAKEEYFENLEDY